MQVVKKERDLKWVPHPFLSIQIMHLLSKKDDQADITCFLVKVPKGKSIEEHVHETQEDIIYVMKGKGRMWVDGVGDFALEPGTFIRVPKNTRHRMYDVTEDLLNFDVFSPPLF
jgi:quercetin dioxygenase-like cupin family protein